MNLVFNLMLFVKADGEEIGFFELLEKYYTDCLENAGSTASTCGPVQ